MTLPTWRECSLWSPYMRNSFTGYFVHMWHCWVYLICWSNRFVRQLLQLVISLFSLLLDRNESERQISKPWWPHSGILAGVTVVALNSLAPMIIPMGVLFLMISKSISLYGGLAVFKFGSSVTPWWKGKVEFWRRELRKDEFEWNERRIWVEDCGEVLHKRWRVLRGVLWRCPQYRLITHHSWGLQVEVLVFY